MPTQAPSISLTVEVERKGELSVVHCRGKLVSGVCSFLYNKVHALIPESKQIVLDLTDLEWVDSMGLGTLVRLYVACKGAGCKLQLINLGPRVRELLGLTNLLGVFADIGEKGVTHF
ncbi:MAG TPA: STAS domain-containing protein [Terracidiphilus sp.]|jgi:anti-anti-sigma factor|nr:STAS domain-containing protein [Terracidiphilus sp.]